MKSTTKLICSIFLLIFGIPALALAGSATLHWQANTESDLAGYRIYYGTSSRSYGPYIPVDKNTTSYTINNLTEGQTYYFALTAVDTSGNESGYSQEVSKSIPESDQQPSQNEVIVLSSLPAEAGTIRIDHEWREIKFSRAYNDPIVIAGPLSYNGPNPCGVRIRNITSTGFQIRIQEWEYLDQWHKMEEVSYMVIEKGHYKLPDGSEIEAGKVTTNKVNPRGDFQKVLFTTSFKKTPVVITTVQTMNGPQMVITRERNLSTTGFELVMSEQENSDLWHVMETIGYIAWEPGEGSVDGVSYDVKSVENVNNNWSNVSYGPFSSAPILIMGIQTTNGGDTANIRFANKADRSVQIFLSEEISLDNETHHVDETVGYLSLR